MIYLDNAATTKCAPEAVEAMLPYLGEKYGNASSIYALGSESRQSVMQEESLQKVLTVRHRKFISQQAVQRQTTGH